LADFSEILRSEAVTRKITAMGQMLSFHENVFRFPNAVWASASDAFRVVSDTFVTLLLDTVRIYCEVDMSLCGHLLLVESTKYRLLFDGIGGSSTWLYCISSSTTWIRFLCFCRKAVYTRAHDNSWHHD